MFCQLLINKLRISSANHKDIIFGQAKKLQKKRENSFAVYISSKEMEGTELFVPAVVSIKSPLVAGVP